jgi:large repetitive protein
LSLKIRDHQALNEQLNTKNKNTLNFISVWFFVFLFVLLSVRGYSQSCTLAVNLSASSTSICSGFSVTLTAAASGGTAPYTYVWSTGENTQSISVNKQATYTVTVSDKTPGCQPVTSSINIIVSATPELPVAFNQVVCPNTSATLVAKSPGGFYQWYDAPAGGNFLGSGDTYVTPPITTPTNFYLQTTINGCTSPRNLIFVDLIGKAIVTGTTVCAGNSATLSAGGADSYQWYNSPNGGNVLGTGPTFTTPPIIATTVFYVVATINGCRGMPTPVTAVVTPFPQTPTAQNVAICSGSSANLHANSPQGGIYSWFDVPVGGVPLISSPDFSTPPLTATTTYYVQNSLNGCESQRAVVTVTVNPFPQAPASQVDTVCNGTGITLTVPNNPSGTYEWYDAVTGGNLLATGVSYNTPVLNNTTNYYVQADNGGCTSARSVVTVVVSPTPAAPSVAGSIICFGSSTTLTATGPGGNYQWYDAGGTLLAPGTSFTTPALTANTTYFVQTTLNGCNSAKVAVAVSVIPPVTPPTAPDVNVCSGNGAVLTVTAPLAGNSYAWYDNLNGGTLLASAPVYFTPPVLVTTTYYVQTTLNGCVSQRTSVTATVNPTPSPPTTGGTTTVCPGISANLTANAPTGTIEWYDAPTGGTLLMTGNNYNTPALNVTTTYYVQNTAGQCVSTRTPVTVQVTPVANPQFQYSAGSFCPSALNPIPVINNPSGGTFSAAPAGLVFVNPTTGEVNLGASAQNNYVISFTSNGPCPGTTSAGFSIVTNPTSQFSYNASYCQDENNALPALIAGAVAGVFSAAPAGLVFVNTSTGEIDLKKSNPGIYTITNNVAASGGCTASTSSTNVTIYQAVTITAGPNQNVLAGSQVQLNGSVTPTGGTWSGGTGTFSNPTNPTATYTPGPLETNAILTFTSGTPAGTCGPKSATVTITFSTVAAPTVSGNSTCLGSTATLSAAAPGGVYQWYNVAAGGNPLSTGATFITPPLLTNTTYYVQTTIGGITSARTAVQVMVNPIPPDPVVQGLTTCLGSPATLKVTDSTGVSAWYDSAIGGNLLSVSNTYVTPALTANQSFYVQTTVNGCVSNRVKADVLVNPIPDITSHATDAICSGNALNYSITSNIPAATFVWGRAQVAGISNPAIANQTSAIINETLTNTTGNAVIVTYIITPAANGCSGSPFNYVVTVNPTPMVTSAANATICSGTTPNYGITFNTATNFTWGRAAVAGVTNAAVTGQAADTIREVLFNNTNAPIDVTYVITSQTSTCPGPSFNLVITVNPADTISSLLADTVCSGTPENYVITSNVPSATFSWQRAAINNISNPAVANQTSGTITETLINTSVHQQNVVYIITPTAYGCTGLPFKHVVTVNPQPAVSVANSNSPVCEGDTIQLRTPVVLNAGYVWTGPNGYTSTAQNPDIDNVTVGNSGIYNLFISIGGCLSPAASVAVVVKQLPHADAGPDQNACVITPAITLAGNVSGGTTTGIWTTSGTGTFSPSISDLTAQYIPSNQDKTSGSVTLTLSSTSQDNCHISTSTMKITFGPKPAVIAGPGQNVCSQNKSVKLNGKLLIPGGGAWSTSGTGTFSPSATQLNADYIPSAADVKSGTVTLTLHINNATQCFIASDSTIINFIPPPTLNAGGTRYVLKNNQITLDPTVSNNNVTYLWSPNIDISSITIKNPVITGTVDRTYILQVTDSLGCVSIDSTFIKVSPQIKIFNTFTPNGDGHNDLWDIPGLIAYDQADVDIFNRWGQKVFHSIGYTKEWDGIYNGEPLPVGVYYYVINTKVNNQILSGWVTIIR